jgi:hypothetical protein
MQLRLQIDWSLLQGRIWSGRNGRVIAGTALPLAGQPKLLSACATVQQW